MPKRKKPMAPKAALASRKSSRPPPAMGSELRARIGDQLRAMHDDIVKEGVPDRFKELLRRLDAKLDKDGA